MNIRVLARWLCVGLLAASLLRDIREPFWGLHDFNTADHAQFARVMLRQPASVHHFLPTYALGYDRPAEPHHYAHHPPLITWLTALSFALFGDHEWSARLAPILCSLVGLLIFTRLVREIVSPTAALLAGAIYAVTPVGAFFGRMANHEAPTLCFALLAVWGWNGIRAGRAPPLRHAAYLLGIACAIYSGWPGTFVAVAIAVDALLYARRRAAVLVECIVWPVVILAVLLIHLVQFGLDGHWDVWWDLLTTRSGGAVPPKQGDDPMRTLWDYMLQNFTWPALLLAGLFLVSLMFARLRGRPARRIGVISLIAAAGLAHLCFYRQAIIHHYWSFYLWPVVANFAAQGIEILAVIVGKCGRRPARVACCAALAVTLSWGLLNTDLYFSYDTYPRNKVAFWIDPALAKLIPPHAPILIAEPMQAREQHGSYTHWWWGEPATAFYMDRPFRVVSRPSEIAAAERFSRWLIVSEEWLSRLPDLQRALQPVTPRYRQWGYRVYDVAGASRQSLP